MSQAAASVWHKTGGGDRSACKSGLATACADAKMQLPRGLLPPAFICNAHLVRRATLFLFLAPPAAPVTQYRWIQTSAVRAFCYRTPIHSRAPLTDDLFHARSNARTRASPEVWRNVYLTNGRISAADTQPMISDVLFRRWRIWQMENCIMRKYLKRFNWRKQKNIINNI